MAHRYPYGPLAVERPAASKAPSALGVRDVLFDGVFTVNRTGRFLDVNAGGTALLGYSRSDLQGRDVCEVVRHGASGERRTFEALDVGGHFYWSGLLERKDAPAIAAEARVVRSGAEEFTIVAREKAGGDVSLETLNDERLMRLTHLRKNILESLNHEFRTPLTTIQVCSQLIKDVIEPEYESMVDDIEHSGNRLLEAFMTLIELARLRADDYPLYPRVRDVAEIVDACVERVRRPADEKGVDVSVRFEERPLSACVDAYALNRIVFSLVDNAVKFTDAGSVRVSAAAAAESVRIDVVDTGVGISPEFLPRVFDAFTQESTGLSRIYQGAGMGLALTAQLVQRMGGRILVNSTKAAGSTFAVILPRGMNPAA